MNKQKEYGGLTFDELIDISKQINRNAKAFLKSKHPNNEHKLTSLSLQDKGKCPYCHFHYRNVDGYGDKKIFVGANINNREISYLVNGDVHLAKDENNKIIISAGEGYEFMDTPPIFYCPICGRKL